MKDSEFNFYISMIHVCARLSSNMISGVFMLQSGGWIFKKTQHWCISKHNTSD